MEGQESPSWSFNQRASIPCQLTSHEGQRLCAPARVGESIVVSKHCGPKEMRRTNQYTNSYPESRLHLQVWQPAAVSKVVVKSWPATSGMLLMVPGSQEGRRGPQGGKLLDGECCSVYWAYMDRTTQFTYWLQSLELSS
eukprot:1158658-Pelagomonas_calceolata.AAC.3